MEVVLERKEELEFEHGDCTMSLGSLKIERETATYNATLGEVTLAITTSSFINTQSHMRMERFSSISLSLSPQSPLLTLSFYAHENVHIRDNRSNIIP